MIAVLSVVHVGRHKTARVTAIQITPSTWHTHGNSSKMQFTAGQKAIKLGTAAAGSADHPPPQIKYAIRNGEK